MPKPPCEYTKGTNHSADRVSVWHGTNTPLCLCGFHASMIDPRFYIELDPTHHPVPTLGQSTKET